LQLRDELCGVDPIRLTAGDTSTRKGDIRGFSRCSRYGAGLRDLASILGNEHGVVMRKIAGFCAAHDFTPSSSSMVRNSAELAPPFLLIDDAKPLRA
jgi:hypothetical protein